MAPTLEDILRDGTTVLALNASLLWGIQEFAPHFNSLLNEYHFAEGVTDILALAGFFYASGKYIQKAAYPRLRAAFGRSTLEGVGKGVLYTLPLPLGFYLARTLPAHLAGGTEEFVKNGLALGTLTAANYWAA